MKISMTGQEKGDCLIGVTAWAGLPEGKTCLNVKIIQSNLP
jgi:hypothetical protein